MIQWWHIYNPHLKQSDEKDAIRERVRKQNDAFLMRCFYVYAGLFAAVILVILLIYT